MSREEIDIIEEEIANIRQKAVYDVQDTWVLWTYIINVCRCKMKMKLIGFDENPYKHNIDSTQLKKIRKTAIKLFVNGRIDFEEAVSMGRYKKASFYQAVQRYRQKLDVERVRAKRMMDK